MIKFPKMVLIICIILIFSASIGLSQLTFKGEYNVFFDPSNPQLQAFEIIQSRFSKTDSMAIVIAPNSGNVFTPNTLKLIKQLTDAAWQTPYSSRVDSLTNYQHTEATEDELLVDDLVADSFEFSTENIHKVRLIALNAPETKNAIVSSNGDVSVINITVQLPNKNMTAEIVEVYDYVSQFLLEYQEKYPDVHFYKAGLVAMNYSFIASAKKDIMTLVPIMLLVIMVFLTLMLRSVFSVFATMIVVTSSVTTAIGLASWWGVAMNIASVNIPTLVLTLAVADCVHIIATMRHQMAKGESKSKAILYSLKINFVPVIITSLTTAIGFLMMNMSDSPALRSFGSLAALGVMLACLFALTLLPALLKLFPNAQLPLHNDDAPNYMDSFSAFVVAKKNLLLVGSVVIIVISAWLISLNRINDEPAKYFSEQSEFRQAADFMQTHISGMGSVSISIDSNEEHGIVEPEFLTEVDSFTEWLRAQPEVDHVTSLTDILKRLNMNMHGDDRFHYRLPENKELAAQYLLMYEMSLPYGLDLNNQINIDKSALKIQVITKNLGSDESIALEQRIYNWFNHNSTSKDPYIVQASSPFMMFAHIGATNMKSMLISLPVSLLMISVLLMLSLRSFKLGLISIIPNMVPAVIGFGMWALISAEINLALSVVASLTLGIVVDDGVHFLAKYKAARQQGYGPEEAIRYSFHHVGQALWITTVVLVAGFSVLAMSTFRLNSDMGILSSLIIFLALVIDFLFLPSLLIVFSRRDCTHVNTDSKLN
uniref:MMPL family transporter n=2 Tax=Vibrio ziniensis TaxID=2711221 RepID=A0A6G7CQT0_9VIBR|nr:MMPL family transporter [Vibrio ziniensis]